MRELPQDVREQLGKAASTANLDAINKIVESLSGTHPRAASALRRMADEFDYGAIKALLD